MKEKFSILAALVMLGGHSAHAQLPSGFAQYQIAEGLNPTDMAVSPDGHIFITEKNGIVRIVEDGVLLPDPFFVLDVNDYNERGLGHIALHPLYPAEPYVYLYYTVPDGSHNVVSRVRSDGHYAVPGSEEILYECDPKIGSVHHGGAMLFGNDGHLYISTGESGPANDPHNDMGKVLRLDADGAIPPDNPFNSVVSGKYKSVYATGFRNPFSMAVQPESGRIFLCDVGGGAWEEINDVLPGKDYGWPLVEGKANGQSVPANYQDPIYSYDHHTGCSIIGAAFYPKQQGSPFPHPYRGRFFFADYCKGFIGMFNPTTGQREQNFITDIRRPVCIRITPQGEFYYLARAGIGGGTEEDNTISTDGSLWRVVYTGSKAPFVYGHPKGGLYSVGDTFALRTYALGEQPLVFQWQKNGVDLAGSDSNILVVSNIQLADSASTYRCVVRNTFGADTSGTAILNVTANSRPVPVITLPDPNFRYRAGEEFSFSGHATDIEEGALPAAALTWKIDFHHDEHIHPALTPVGGFSEGMYYVQDEGEPDDNVWYRIYLTAQDSIGLSRTTWREVYPQKTAMTVKTNPSGISVNVDGITGFSPYVFQSVVGLKRTISLPYALFKNDTLLLFDRWHNGSIKPVFPFATPTQPIPPIEANYHKYPRAQGFGLWGEYFNLNGFGTGGETALLSRMDTTIQFEWLEGSPEPGYVPYDNFAVRWSGDVVPFFDDTITFHTLTDDGVRLWVNDSLLIDKWSNQPKIGYSGSIFLKGGQRYHIKMEYLEAGGAASANLFWSSTRLPKDIVPKSQLYPPKKMIPNTLHGRVWLDSLTSNQPGTDESPLKGAAVILYDLATETVAAAATTDEQGRYELAGLPSGDYQGYVLPPLEASAFGPGFGLNSSGHTEAFSLNGEETLEKNFSFVLLQNLPTASRSWSVAPNPSNGIFQFKKHFNVGVENMSIRVFNHVGKLVLEKQLAENEWQTALDLSNMVQGLYVVSAAGKELSIMLIR